MADTKGHCKHGEFILTEGCPDCIQEERERRETESLGEEIPVEEPEQETGRAEREPGSEEGLGLMVNIDSTTTAVVKVKPEVDQAVIALHEQSLKLEQYAVALVIGTNEDVKNATNDLSIISGLKKAIEEKRKEYTQPINDHLKAVNEAFKALVEPLLSADKITRTKVLEYRAEQERKCREAEDIARVERETAERKAALTGEPIVLPEPVETTAPPPDHYRAEMGALGKSVLHKWEVIDFSLIPDSYKKIDAGAVTNVVKASKGKIVIPGIRIWDEETLRVTTKKEDE